MVYSFYQSLRFQTARRFIIEPKLLLILIASKIFILQHIQIAGTSCYALLLTFKSNFKRVLVNC